MDHEAALAAFDQQMRKNARADTPGARIERVGDVVRQVPTDKDGWTGVVWSALDEATAEAAIADQIRYFAGLGRAFEWKHYGHDLPRDLPQRLLAAGFEAEREEAVMVAEIADLDLEVAPPDGVQLVPVSDEASIDRLARVHEEVFGTDHGRLAHELGARLADAPETMAAVVAMAGTRAVCSARVELHTGTAFASLWGGGTLPSFRGRGVYRATVAYRARLAAARGFRYVQVDALPASRVILERLGFAQLTTTTPYVRRV